ncbi:MAG TPA: hypothetical protein VJ722_09530 [Rhodanobacteraceae bacterium]|nr:hypothetical protein [Rhodanobacteraceae bacterium]
MVSPDRPSAEPVDDQLPRRTTPTWEVELLISGVAVFAMLQLPGWLNDRLLFLLPRFDNTWNSALAIVCAYLVGAAAILAATFALHLLLRAYWIALVGMHSVYPEGIRWERLRIGPIEREVMQRRDGDFLAMVERADNRASIVFAMGVALAASLLILTALVVVLFAAASAVAMALHLPLRADRTLLGCVLVVALPVLLLHMLDRKVGARLHEGGRARRGIAAIFNLYARLGFSNRGGVLAMLSSHHGRGRVQAVATAAMMLCVFFAVSSQLIARHPEMFGSYAWFPHFGESGAHVVSAVHYDDQRDPLRSPAVPFIQSAEIDGNYIRLTVPYHPDRDAAAMQRNCATSATIAATAERATAMLRCLAGLHPVTLDGAPLTNLRYDAGSDALTERPALVARIDVRTLGPGRHELAIARAAAGSDDEPASSSPVIIPFWR